MDIFTTQLTRVVPVPIKPANLKVKALLKDAGAGKLKEDLDHLENHEYYFQDELKKQHNQQQNKKGTEQDGAKLLNCDPNKGKPSDNTLDEAGDDLTESKDGSKHLDLYV